MDNKKILLFSFFLLFLVFGCTTQPPVSEMPEDGEGPTDSDGIDLDDQNNEQPVQPVDPIEEEGKVEIVMSKDEYLFGETIEFELHNGTEEDIWYVENLDGCNDGPFYVKYGGDNVTPLLGPVDACALSEYSLKVAHSGESHGFSIDWDFMSFMEWGMWQVSPGEYKIYMVYHDDLNLNITDTIVYYTETPCCPKELFSESFKVLEIEENDLCSADSLSCETNSDCFSSEECGFVGNKQYFEYCVNKIEFIYPKCNSWSEGTCIAGRCVMENN